MSWAFMTTGYGKGSVLRDATYFYVSGKDFYQPGTYQVVAPVWVGFVGKAENVGSSSDIVWIALADHNGIVLKVNSGSVAPGGTIDISGSVYIEPDKVYCFAFYAGHGTPPAQGRLITSWDDVYGD